jgi:hypothetical protein
VNARRAPQAVSRYEFSLRLEVAADRGHALTADGDLNRLQLTDLAGFGDAKLSLRLGEIGFAKGASDQLPWSTTSVAGQGRCPTAPF